MARRLRRALAIGLATLAGCGAPETRPPDPLDRYPEQRFIVAEGRGATALAAGDDARVRLSASIRARMTARLTVESSESAAGTAERVEQRIVTETTFDRAELIRLPRALQRCPQPAAPDGCVAVAVLDRAEASGALRDAAVDPAQRFGRSTDAALAAGPDDWLGFTTGLRGAEAAYADRARSGWQQAVIDGAMPADFAADRGRFRALQAERARRLTGLRITVRPAVGLEGPWAARVEDAVIDAFGRLGPTASRATPCEGLAAQPSGQTACARGSLGPTCRSVIRVDLTRCDGSPLVTLEPPPISAVDPRDPARAARRLAERITGQRLAPPLARGLVGVLPIARPDSVEAR